MGGQDALAGQLRVHDRLLTLTLTLRWLTLTLLWPHLVVEELLEELLVHQVLLDIGRGVLVRRGRWLTSLDMSTRRCLLLEEDHVGRVVASLRRRWRRHHARYRVVGRRWC